MHGTVTGLNEHTVVLRVADQVKLELTAPAIPAASWQSRARRMPRHLRVRIAFVLLVVAVSVWYLYPEKALNLGLDLQGGIHLMLGVEADKHVASQTDRTAGDLKKALERKGIGVQRIAREGNSTIQGGAGQPAVVERRAHRGGRVLHLHAKR